MKIDLGKALKTAVSAVKRNPEIALAIAGILAPKLVTKIVPVIAAVQAGTKGGEEQE